MVCAMSWPLRTDTRKALAKLSEAVHVLLAQTKPPTLKGPKDHQWFKFPQETVYELILVKAVRVVSGLNAMTTLLYDGYTVEAAVVLRTIDDFIDEITYLIESIEREEMTSGQKAFVAAFFSATIQPLEEKLKDRPRPDRAKRKEIQASQGRYLDDSNPDRFRKFAKAIDGTLDGFVHGDYPHSMELFLGTAKGGHFLLEGTLGSHFVESMWTQHGFYVSRAFSVLGMVALKAGLPECVDELREARNAFEASPAYSADDDP